MLKFLQKPVWPPNYQDPPWGAGISILDHLARQTAPADPSEQTDDDRLPDEPEPTLNGFSFAPGMMDGVTGRHFSAKSEGQVVADLYNALKSAIKSATKSNIRALYTLLKESSAASLLDRLLDQIVTEGSVDTARLRDLALWFATKAPDREPVKFSMAILGLLRGTDDSEVFLTLGRHDEFTLYASVAIMNNDAYGEAVLVRLAKSVHGWGRIATVERLAKTGDAGVKDWLLRDGYKNSIMYEYLACICARAGELHLAIEKQPVDDDLFGSACEIIDTLIAGDDGGPAEGLSQYEHGCAAIGALLRQDDNRFRTASQFRFLTKLKEWIARHISGKAQLKQDWTDAASVQIQARLEHLISSVRWKAIILAALDAGDQQEFWSASRVCAEFGIDPWPHFFRRIENGGDHWWDLMRTTDETRIDQVLDLGLRCLPLARVCTGPGLEHGFGPDHRTHGALGFILQDLGRFPGKGWPFISAGLKSPAIRNRHCAIRALSDWDREVWPKDALAAVNALLAVEPADSVKDEITSLLMKIRPH